MTTELPPNLPVDPELPVTSGETSVETPEQAPGQTPGQAPGQTPEHTPGQTAKPLSRAAAEKTLAEMAGADPSQDCHECLVCGYIYEPLKGDNRRNVSPNTSFTDLAVNWRCPVCSAPKSQFKNVGPKGAPSGFKENLSYGFGVNMMTPGQKSVLIFGALGLVVLFFLSLYGLR